MPGTREGPWQDCIGTPLPSSLWEQVEERKKRKHCPESLRGFNPVRSFQWCLMVAWVNLSSKWRGICQTSAGAQYGHPLVKICLAVKNFPGTSSNSGVLPWLEWAQDSIPQAAMCLAWHLCCCRCSHMGTGLWEGLVAGVGLVTLGPAVKMSFSLFTRALPCGQAQALWNQVQEAQPVTAGHCQGQLGHSFSFVSIYCTRARLMPCLPRDVAHLHLTQTAKAFSFARLHPDLQDSMFCMQQHFLSLGFVY